MTSLPDAERAACDVVQALGALAAVLSRLSPDDPPYEDVHRMLCHLAEDGSNAAEQVLDYLRALRGAGDGAAAAVPPRLAPWRDWVPPRGHLIGGFGPSHRIGELPKPRRYDPGE